MSRKTLMTIHLYLAAFFTPMIVIMAVSGGLYLFDIKGSMDKGTPIVIAGAELKGNDDAGIEHIKSLLSGAGLDDGFEYLKDRGSMMQTRPTSRDYYEIKQTPQGVEFTPVSPSLVAAMMELHKGHGPQIFRTLQQVLAVGLVLILISGLILGLQSPMLKNKTIAVTAGGILVFVLVAAF
ncbi:MAG: hypothetical protein P1U57_13025 [Oleibacter sp.]|nr:hypothetical protein [Thalassolituus sp.]